jgi:hypothetical protein
MFAEFITANWKENRLLVYGLSSLGKSLNPEISDDEYLDKGPENFGYVVTSDGLHEKDLTYPLTKGPEFDRKWRLTDFAPIMATQRERMIY